MASWFKIPIAVLALATFLPSSVGGAGRTPPTSPKPVMTLIHTGFGRYVVFQIEQMTAPKNPLFDAYLAGHIHGRSLNDLDVITTFNPRLQRAAQQFVTIQIRSLGRAHITDGALVSLDLRPGCYGCILSMIGTANLDRRSAALNLASTPRQPGSSFMPFDYLAGFKRRLSPGTTVLDAPIKIRDPAAPNRNFAPDNYDHTYHGLQSLRLSLGNSFNIPAVKVELYTTPRAVGNTAFRLGISDLWRDNPHCCGYAIALGGMERGVSLVQETAAYGALATNGIKVTPISFKEISDRATGKVLWRYSRDPVLRRRRVRVAPAVDAYMITSILSDNTARSREFGPSSPLSLDRPAAAQAGFTNAFTDNWTVGYTSSVVTGVWVGNSDNSPMVGATGITGAAPIWHIFMESAFRILKLSVASFPRPMGLTVGNHCRRVNRTAPAHGTFTYGPDLYPTGTTSYCTVPAVAGLDMPAN